MTRGRYRPSFVVIRWVILTLSWGQIQILPLCWQHDWAKVINMATNFSHAHIYIYILMWILKGMALNGLKGIASNGLYSTCIDRYMTICRRIFSYDHTTLARPPMTGNKLMWFQSTNKSNVKCQNTLHCLDQYTAPMPRKACAELRLQNSLPWSGLGRWSSLIIDLRTAQVYCFAIFLHVDTRPISPFLFFFDSTFYLCIIIVIFYLMYLIH